MVYKPPGKRTTDTVCKIWDSGHSPRILLGLYMHQELLCGEIQIEANSNLGGIVVKQKIFIALVACFAFCASGMVAFEEVIIETTFGKS